MTPLRSVLWIAVSTEAQAADDKESLLTQESDQRALAEREGWRIVDVLRVPGHSRRYIDIHEIARDMQAQGINAFTRLLELWAAHDFDVLVVRDASRFARTQTLHSYVVESTIDAGARIYSLADGWVDDRNYRMFISMSGYASAGEIDRLKARHQMGMEGRYKRGLYGSAKPFSHIIIDDKVVLDHSKDRFFADLKELLLTGLGYVGLPDALVERGHERVSHVLIWKMLHHPCTYGHMAYMWRNAHGTWAYDARAPLPPGAKITRNVIEPVWKGQDMADVIANLRYRAEIGTGRATREATRMFTGLLICGECGYTMGYFKNSERHVAYYRCITRYFLQQRKAACTQHIYLREDAAELQLRALLDAGDIPALFAVEKETVNRLVLLKDELDQLEAKIRVLIKKQADAPDIADLYDDDITRLRQLRAAKRGEVDRLSPDTEDADIARQREYALMEIHAPDFWDKPAPQINQMLFIVAGNHRFVVMNGKLTDVKRVK